jgi:spore maturation protein CgeD
MEPAISVFLPSYNKGEWVLDAMRSVFGQSRADWELWLLENSSDGRTNLIVEDELTRHFGLQELDGDEWLAALKENGVHYERLEGAEIERKRRETYMTSWLLNVYYPEASGKYVFYISDDDIIDPDCFEVMAGELDANPEYRIVYAGLRHYTPSAPGDCGPAPDKGIPALDPKMFPGSVDNRVDGGQVMHWKACLDHLVYPYFEEGGSGTVSRHVDGIFLERLVGRFPFWPINRYLVTHRWTELSVWSSKPPDTEMWR